MKRIAKQDIPKSEIDQFYAKRFNITQFLFDKQLEFVQNTNPFKVAVCSRRSGKTTACAAHLINTAISTPESQSLYITLAATNAKRIVWKELKKINTNYKLLGKTNDVELSITFPNGSIIYVSGAKDKSEIEKFRGLAMHLVYIDECQSFREYIKDLIDDIISPTLADYAGSLCLIGTPGPVPSGFFHECAVESEVWSKHYWSFWDNPYIPIKSGHTHDQIFERELKRRGVTSDDPSIQREWYGKWVLDSDSLLIKYKADKNHFNDIPDNQYYYVMGVDIGFKDADAIAILAYSDADPTTYLVQEIIKDKQGLTELVEDIQSLRKKYDITKIVMDMGGLGRKIGEEIIKRHNIPIEAAEKSRKMENIEFLNDALRTGKFKAKKNSRFAEDSYKVEINKDKSRPERIVVSDTYHSDIIDAVLYAFKLSPAYAYELPLPPKPKYGSKEWAQQEVNDMFEAELEAALQEQEKNRSGFDF